MSWLDIQKKLEVLVDEYSNYDVIKQFVFDENNYQTQNPNLFNTLFYLSAAMKKQINDIPETIDVVRNEILKYGNNLEDVSKYLQKVIKDFDVLNRGYKVFKTLIMLIDKEYEFKEGYENSLSCKSFMDRLNKIIEIYEKDDMPIKEKYEYLDSFDNTLSIEEKGELHIQTFIGKIDEVAKNRLTTPLLMNEMKKGNPFKRMQKIHDIILQTGAYAQDQLEKSSLEEQLTWLECILESEYVKNMNGPKKS